MALNRSVFRRHGDKLLFAIALAVLAAALFRPGTGAGNAVTQIIAPKAEVVFTQWWRGDLEKNALEDLITEFESLHSNIKIILNDMGYEDLRYLFFNSAETGGARDPIPIPGDVLALDPLWVPELLKRKTVENAGAPILSFINVLYYNVDILREAGFMRPPKNRSEFFAYTKAVTGGEKLLHGLAMDGNSSRFIYEDVYSWIWAAGARLINDGKPAIDSRVVGESLSFLASLNKEGLIAPDVFSTKLEDFISGKAAFMIAPASNIRQVRERMGDSAFGITSVPVPDNYAGKSFFGTAAWTIGIHSESSHKEEANLFMAFLVDKAPVLSEKAKAVPGSAITPPGQDPFYSKAWDIAIAGESAQDFFRLAGERKLEEIFREELAALFTEQLTPAETAAAIQKRWNAVLTEM